MTPPTPAELAELAVAIQERWAAGETPDALAALAAHPELATDRKLVIELAYEEFCLRAEAGVPPEPVVFAARFPFPDDIAALFAVQSALHRQFSAGLSRRPSVTLNAGEQVGDLQVHRLLGRGGFSDVYLVRNMALGKRVEVLKVSTRGKEEANTLGPLNHSHLMPVYAAPTVVGHRAVVSPYHGLATGETLVNRSNGKPSTDLLLRVVGERWDDDPVVANPSAFPVSASTPYPRAVLSIAAATADTLKYLHAHRVAHRDLKPSNLLLGPTAYPYLLDLNLAGDGQVGGTVAYAAPEVIARLAADQPDGQVDWYAADVFSFAVLVFELLLARHPYLVGAALTNIGETTVSNAAKSAQSRLASTSLPLPASVRRVLLDCLAVNPAERPNAGELARVLSAAVAPRRRWVPILLATTLLTAGVAGGGVWLAANQDREPTDPLARGCWLMEKGESEVAVISFQQAAKTDTSGRATEWLAYCYARNSAYPLAIAAADQAEGAGRKTPAVYANRAAAELFVGNNAAAVADADKAVALDQGCAPAKLTLGLAVYKMEGRGKPVSRKTLDTLEAAIPGNEGHAGLWLSIAEARVRVADANDADRDRAIDAVRESLLAGGRREAVKTNVIKEALAKHPRWNEVLATEPIHTTANAESQLVRPQSK